MMRERLAQTGNATASHSFLTLNLFPGLPMVTGTLELSCAGGFVLVKRGMSNWKDQHSRPGDSFAGEAFQFQIEAKRQLVVVKFGKRVTAKEIREYAQKLQADSSFQSSFSEIVDLREAMDIELQADDFLTLADAVDPFSPEAKRAFVAKTSVQNHAARMHKILRSQRNIEIFCTLEEAERWVSL